MDLVRIFYFIYVTIYLVYLINVIFGWYIPTLSTRSIVLGATILLLLLIFCMSILITLNVKNVYLINSRPLTVLCIAIIILSFVLYYQYSEDSKVYQDIVTKVRRSNFTPLTYQYGDSMDEIFNRFNLTVDIPAHINTLSDFWSYIMVTSNYDKAQKIIKNIMGASISNEPEIVYDLLWYLLISNNPLGNNLNKYERSYVASLKYNELRDIVGENYTGALDKASLYFAILSGQMIAQCDPAHHTTCVRDSNNNITLNTELVSNRYVELKKFDPSIIHNLSFIHQNMINHATGEYIRYGPYKILSLAPVSNMETILSSVYHEDMNDLITRLGIGPIHKWNTMNENERILYLQGDLSLYHNVFNRSVDLYEPPNLRGMSRDEIYEILLCYTNQELINEYEPRSKWTSRSELLQIIYDDITGTSRWSLTSLKYCNNDDTINVLTGEPHGEINKHDNSDPTLSYGVQKNYRCFQAEELTASFREYDGIFSFQVPDWTDTAVDPITQNPLIREFPLESMKQLQELLEREQLLPELVAKIQEGMKIMKSATMKIRSLRQTMNSFTETQKQTVKLYLAWMFTYSMWMRFWKGPGYHWPMNKININNQGERNRWDRAEPRERDEHIFIQHGIRSYIIEMYETDPILKDWIETLPTIYYDFDTQDAKCATYNIKEVIDKLMIGDYCMGFGADTCLKTSYYYIVHLLDQTLGAKFDTFIQSMFPQLLDLEYNVVNSQLTDTQSNNIRLHVLNQRLHALQQTIPKQPSFDPVNYSNNIHVN